MALLEKLKKEYCPNGVKIVSLKEIGTFYGGLSGKSKSDFSQNGNAKYITYMNAFSNLSMCSIFNILHNLVQFIYRFF